MRRLHRSLLVLLALGAAPQTLGPRSASAQVVPAPGFIPAAVHGTTPIEYHHLVQTANDQFQSGDYPAAAATFRRVVQAYPVVGEHWRRLGISLRETGSHREGARALAEADRRGILPYPQYNAVNAAREYLRAGEPDSAIHWLERAMHVHRWTDVPQLAADTSFAALHGDSRFMQMVGRRSAVASRDERWRQDLDHLVSEVQRANGVYRGILPDTMLREAARLRESIPRLSDTQILVGMQRMLALLRQSHNSLFPAAPQVPVTLYAFSDGMFVVGADSAHQSLVGMRVERIGERTVREVLSATEPLEDRDHPGNEWLKISYVERPAILHALGLIPHPDSVRLTLTDSRGVRVVRSLATAPSYKSVRKLLAPTQPGLPATPLWLSRPDDHYWVERIPGTATAYMQFNRVVNNPGGENLGQFGLRLREFLAEQGIRELVVDVRRNIGGNTYLYTELLRTLIAFDAQAGNRLFVIVGRGTFSAAQNFITEVDRLTHAVFVGEPSGGSPIQRGGDESPIILPHSRAQGGLASAVWQLTGPRDTRPFIVPDVPVALSSADYYANRDPVLETALQLIRTGERK